MVFALAAPLLEGVVGGAAVESAAAGGVAAAEGATAAAGGATSGTAANALNSGLMTHFAGGHQESRGGSATAPAGPGSVAHQTNPVFNT